MGAKEKKISAAKEKKLRRAKKKWAGIVKHKDRRVKEKEGASGRNRGPQCRKRSIVVYHYHGKWSWNMN